MLILLAMQDKPPANLFPERLNALAAVPVAVLFLMLLVQVIRFPKGPDQADWLLPCLISLATASTLTALARQLQWQYVLSAAFICALIGSVADTLSLNSGIPFGPFVFGPAAGVRFFDRLPWTVPVLWILVLFNSRGVGRLILKPWRKMKTYGFWLIGLTVALSTLFDLGMDPFMGHLQHYWLWSPTKFPLTWMGAPLINFLGWMFVTLLILAFATPVLIKKQPGQRNPSDFHPLVLWVGAMTLFAVAAGRHGLWEATGLDVVAVVAALVAAIRGGRW
jgi:uncharacterized membrane protein